MFKIRNGEKLFNRVLFSAAVSVIVLLVLLVLLLLTNSIESINKFGLGFLTGSDWNPVETEINSVSFGAYPYIRGTVVTSLLALLIATPISIFAALYLVESAPKWVNTVFGFLIQILAALPSVVYGLWGLFKLVPLMRSSIEPFLKNTFGRIPIIGELFQGPIIGLDILTASIVLAVMIIPTILTISREIISQVPAQDRQTGIQLGLTKWEIIRKIIWPNIWIGVFGAAMLGLARALGETMAVSMVIGNSFSGSGSLLSPGYSIASAIANQFTEADSPLYFSALVELGLVLLLVTSVFNVGANIFIRNATRRLNNG